MSTFFHTRTLMGSSSSRWVGFHCLLFTSASRFADELSILRQVMTYHPGYRYGTYQDLSYEVQEGFGRDARVSLGLPPQSTFFVCTCCDRRRILRSGSTEGYVAHPVHPELHDDDGSPIPERMWRQGGTTAEENGLIAEIVAQKEVTWREQTPYNASWIFDAAGQLVVRFGIESKEVIDERLGRCGEDGIFFTGMARKSNNRGKRTGAIKYWWAKVESNGDQQIFSASEDLGIEDARALIISSERRRARMLQRAHSAVSIEQGEHSASRESIPDDVKIFVWRRDGGACVRCGASNSLEFDHIIPLVMGGANTARNLQILCEACNRAKGGNLV